MTCSNRSLLALTVASIALFAAPPLAAQSYNFTTLAGMPGEAGNVDGTGSAARFNNPTDVAVDAAGNVYVIDNGKGTSPSTIRKISPAGEVTTFAGGGTGVDGPDGLDGQGTAAHFGWPKYIATNSTGDLFVGDHAYRVRKITVSGRVSTIGIAAIGNISNIPAPPFGIAVDSQDNVCVIGHGGLFRFSPEGVRSLPIPIEFGGPMVAGDRGEFFVAAGNLQGNFDNSVRRIAVDGALSVIAGGPNDNTVVDGIGTTARFRGFGGIARDASGRLFVTDLSGTVRTVDSDGRVTTVAGQPYATEAPGAPRAVDGVGGATRFDDPAGIAIDRWGTLYVADTATHVIRKGTPTSAISLPIVTVREFRQNQSVGAGNTVTFAATVSLATPSAGQWSRDGVDLAGATNPTLILRNVTGADRGNYTFSASNSGGSRTVTAGTLQVYVPPVSGFSTRREKAGGSSLWGLAAGSGQLVAVGTGGTILTSPDGNNWTPRSSGTTDWLVGVTYGAGKFVAVGDHGRILISPDGATWTAATSTGKTQRLNNVVYGEGTFVAVGEAGTIVTSPDGQTWTTRQSGVTGWLRGLVYSPTARFVESPPNNDELKLTFVATGQDGTVLRSPDGKSWIVVSDSSTEPPRNTARDLEAITTNSSGRGFAGIDANGRISETIVILLGPTSAGETLPKLIWNTESTGVPKRFRGIAWSAYSLLAVGEDGAIISGPSWPSSSPQPWALVPSGTRSSLMAVIAVGDSLYVVGENETILQWNPLFDGRLINISTRGQAGTGSDTMISGFVIQGPGPKQVLLRGIGPTLANYGLTGVLSRPTITLFDTAGRTLASNTAWGTAANALDIQRTAARVGAFALPANSADSALLLTLEPGAYTAHVTGSPSTGSGQVNNTTGLALVEAYDADAMVNDGPRAINISTRGRVGVGQDHLIAGFVIKGVSARRVLIRAAGPSLADYGVSGVLAEPQLILHNSDGYVLKTAGAWGAEPNAEEIRDAASRAGAFPFADAGKDSAIVTTLLPGIYTVEVAGKNDTTGVALVEVYDLP